MTTSGGLRMTAVPNRAAIQRGYTLIELLIVVALLGLAASFVIPSPTIGASRKLDLVATEMANAMRFARSEAMRTGERKGIEHDKDAYRLRVFSLNTDTAPATFDYDVYHPVDKSLYLRQYDQKPYSFDGEIENSLAYRDTCDRKQAMYFDSTGVPWCTDPDNVLLEEFEVSLRLGSESRVVTIHGITGRVTVQ